MSVNVHLLQTNSVMCYVCTLEEKYTRYEMRTSAVVSLRIVQWKQLYEASMKYISTKPRKLCIS